MLAGRKVEDDTIDKMKIVRVKMKKIRQPKIKLKPWFQYSEFRVESFFLGVLEMMADLAVVS